MKSSRTPIGQVESCVLKCIRAVESADSVAWVCAMHILRKLCPPPSSMGAQEGMPLSQDTAKQEKAEKKAASEVYNSTAA